MSIPTFGTSAFVVGPFSYDSESGWDSTYHLPKRSRCTRWWAMVAGGKYCSCFLTLFKLYNLIFFLHKFKILKGIFFQMYDDIHESKSVQKNQTNIILKVKLRKLKVSYVTSWKYTVLSKVLWLFCQNLNLDIVHFITIG